MTSIILKTLALATALVVSAPAFAAPSAPQQKMLLKYDAKTHKYCLTDPAVTGSRIDRTVCQTSAEWTARGLNMPKQTLLADK